MTARRTETLADGVTLHLADCREILPTLPRTAAIVSDPPYGIAHKTDSTRFSGGGVQKAMATIYFANAVRSAIQMP